MDWVHLADQVRGLTDIEIPNIEVIGVVVRVNIDNSSNGYELLHV